MKRFMLSLLSGLFIIINMNAQSQISGKIIDKSNGEGLVGAAVMIDKTTTGAITDIEGNFTIPIDAGNYVLNISFISYESAKIAVEVKPKETAFVNYAMAEAKALLQNVC